MKDAPINLPPDRGDAVNLARNVLEDPALAITPKGVRILAEAVMKLDAAILADRAARAPQAGWEQDAKRFAWLADHLWQCTFRFNKEPNTPKGFTLTCRDTCESAIGNELRRFIDTAIAAAPNAQEE